MAKTLYECGGVKVSVTASGGLALVLVGAFLAVVVLLDLRSSEILLLFASVGLLWLGIVVLRDERVNLKLVEK